MEEADELAGETEEERKERLLEEKAKKWQQLQVRIFSTSRPIEHCDA